MRQMQRHLLGALVLLLMLTAVHTARASRRLQRTLTDPSTSGKPRRQRPRLFIDVKKRLWAWGAKLRANTLRARLREIFKSATRMPIVDRDNANLQFTRAKRGGLLLTLWVSLD